MSRRMPTYAGVEVIGADEIRRRRNGRHVRVLGGGAAVALELRLAPIGHLVWE